MLIDIQKKADCYTVVMDDVTMNVRKEDLMLMSEALRWYSFDNFGDDYKTMKRKFAERRHSIQNRNRYDPSKRNREHEKEYGRMYRERKKDYFNSKEYKVIRAERRRQKNDKEADNKRDIQIYGVGTLRCRNDM